MGVSFWLKCMLLAVCSVQAQTVFKGQVALGDARALASVATEPETDVPTPTTVIPGNPFAPIEEKQENNLTRDIVGISVAGLIVFIAAGGGTGGGGVLDPIYMLIIGLAPKTAFPISSITIVGGAIGNFILNVKRARPYSAKSLIDWDVILAMQPLLLMGASIGVLINSLMPAWMLCFMLVGFLGYAGYRTCLKAYYAIRQEDWRCCGRKTSDTSYLLGVASQPSVDSYNINYRADVPWKKVGYLFGLFAGIVLLRVLTGGPGFASPIGLSQNSFFYPFLAFMPLILLLVFSHYSLKNIVSTFQQQQNPQYVLSRDEIQWSPRTVRSFPWYCLGAGSIAGMFGIGGGIINAPLLLELGVDPAAASAMTAVTVLFSSGMSSVNYMLMGVMDFHYARWTFPMGLLLTLLGQVVLLRLVQKYRCPSLVIASMAIIIVISGIGMAIESLKALIES